MRFDELDQNHLFFIDTGKVGLCNHLLKESTNPNM